jgi:hypothetical protein
MKTRYAGITKRSGNRMPFVYRWSDYDGPHSKSFATLAEAREFQLGIERAKYDGSYTSPEKGKITFGEWAETWFERQTKRGELKPKTMAGYRDLLDKRVLPRWQRVPLGKIDFDPVDAWVAELSAELSPSRVRQCYFLLTGTLDAAVKAKLLTMNAARGVELPRLNDTEAKRRAAVVDPHRDAVPGQQLPAAGLRSGRREDRRAQPEAPRAAAHGGVPGGRSGGSAGAGAEDARPRQGVDHPGHLHPPVPRRPGRRR